MTHSDAIVLCATINTSDVRPIREGWHAEPKLCASFSEALQAYDGEWQAILDHCKSKHVYMITSLDEWNAFCAMARSYKEEYR